MLLLLLPYRSLSSMSSRDFEVLFTKSGSLNCELGRGLSARIQVKFTKENIYY